MRENEGKNVSLTPEHHAFVDAMVASGQYDTAGDVMRAALRLLQRQERRRLLEKWVVEGLTTEEEAQLGPETMAGAREAADQWIEESLASGEPEEVNEPWLAERRSELKSLLERKGKKRT